MSAPTVKLVDIPEELLSQAANLAMRFHQDFPDRMGLMDGVGYRPAGSQRSYYAYRLKSMIVVRGSSLASTSPEQREQQP